jgi:hypothetical protein
LIVFFMSRTRVALAHVLVALLGLAFAVSAAQARPAQQAATTTAPCAGPFTVGAWPGGCWHPYAATSPFNRAISATPLVRADSAAIVARVLGFGAATNLVAGTAGTTSDWQHPTYYPQAADPLFTLHCTETWGTCAIEGMTVRVPDAARPAAGSDHHMTIVDQATGWEYDLWNVTSKPAGGGTLSFGWGGRTRIDGDGLGSDATAARFGNLAGIIRAQEMQAGRIDHALFMVINCDAGAYVYPALKAGRACADRTSAAPMGSRFQLNMSSAEIEALAVPAWKKTILHAMAEYGMYFGDTGGGGFGLQFESGSTYTSFGYQDAMVTFAAQNGVPLYQGKYIFDLKTGVDYANRLRVLDPCSAQGTC